MAAPVWRRWRVCGRNLDAKLAPEEQSLPLPPCADLRAAESRRRNKTMTETAFDADEWIDRLGASLDGLAAESEFSLSLDDGPGPYFTLDQFRARHEGASHRSGIRDTMMPSGAQWSGDLAEQRAILRDHPVLRRALKGIGEEESLLCSCPCKGPLVSSRDLVLSLLRRTARSTGQETARLLHRYLTDGEARQLEAREFVVLYGLKLAGRIDLGSGSFVALLDDQFLSEEGFTEEHCCPTKIRMRRT